MKELELQKHGLPILSPWDLELVHTFIEPGIKGKSHLLLGQNSKANANQIAKFSKRDAERYELYEHWLNQMVKGISPLIDQTSIDIHGIMNTKSLGDKLKLSSPRTAQGIKSPWYREYSFLLRAAGCPCYKDTRALVWIRAPPVDSRNWFRYWRRYLSLQRWQFLRTIASCNGRAGWKGWCMGIRWGRNGMIQINCRVQFQTLLQASANKMA